MIEFIRLNLHNLFQFVNQGCLLGGKHMDETKKMFRYRSLAEEIEQKIRNGTYQSGERLPSIRKLHKQSNLSISTIYHAYMELESMGLVEARPKSGYYVNPVALQNLKVPRFKKGSFPPKKVRLSAMMN